MKKHIFAGAAVAVLISVVLVRPGETEKAGPASYSPPQKTTRIEPQSFPEEAVSKFESSVPIETSEPTPVFVETENPDRMQRRLLSIPLNEFRSLVGTERLDRIVRNVIDKLEARNRDRESALVEISYFLNALNHRIETTRS